MTLATDEIRQRIRTALTSQKRPTVTVLSSLLATQDEFGYLPDEAIEEVAAFNEASTNDVWGVASFYTNFRFTPPAQHVIEVCWGPTCHLLGAPIILKQVQDDLGLSGEGETEDSKVTLKYNTCLGACSQAPGRERRPSAARTLDKRAGRRLGTRACRRPVAVRGPSPEHAARETGPVRNAPRLASSAE